MGFRVLRNLSDRREVCTSCHNKASPTFIGFDLREFSRKIAHWVDKDDAAYYAEYGEEANRRATAAVEAEPSLESGDLTSADSAARAAEEAALIDTLADAAAKAAYEAAKMEEQALADAAAYREMVKKSAEKHETLLQKTNADAALKAKQAKAKAQAEAAAAREAEAEQAAPPSTPAENPLAKYLDDVDDTIRMNTDGKKYKSFKFPHRKHATGRLYNDIACQTCHHTLEGDDSPQSCNECHAIGGDADEEKTKKFYAHAKGLEFAGAREQEEISCASCHKAMNRLLAAGEREGEKAPVKCTQCHARNKK
jgi:hypothetical protein